MVIDPVADCNLSLLHSYASPEQWMKLAELTQQTHLLQWVPLILQKIRHLVLFGGRSKQDKEVNKLVKYLVDHIEDCQQLWFNNFKYLLPLMNHRQLETIAKKMMSSSDYWKPILFDLDVTEKRHVQMAIICAILRSIHDQSRKRGADDDTTALLPASQSVLNMLSLQADLWITSTDRQVKEVTVWIRQSAEQLRQVMRTEEAFVSSRDLSDLFQPLELLERLPLEFFIGSAHSAALIGLLCLVVSCQCQDAIRNRLWMLIVRLLDSGEKLSSLFDLFPSAEFLTWAVPNTRTLPDSANIFAALFDEVLRSPQGLKDAIKWINSSDLDLSSLNITVLAMKKLGAQQNKAAAVEMSTSLRNHFLKSFPSALTEQTVIALQGALFVLQMYTEQSKNSKSTTDKLIEIEPLLSDLDSIVRVAKEGILSTDSDLGSASTELLAFLLTNKCKSLTSHLPHGLLVDVWNTYRQSCHPPRWKDRLLRQLIGMSSKGEMLIMTNFILKDLQTVSDASEKVTVNELKRVGHFFRHLVTVEFYTDEPRYGLRLQAVQTALPLIQHSVLTRCRQPNLSSGDVVQFSVPLMEIYLAILNLDKPYAYPHDAASALHACLALPLDAEMSIDTFEAVFTVVYKVLHYLLVKHEEIAADRIPVLLQAYKRLLVQTCTRSDQRRILESDELVRLTDCANRLSRLASVINSQRMRYRRSATYLVADLMNEFKQRPIYQPVRHELEPALHHLLDLLDHHATRYLLTVLPAGVRELFRIEHEQFEKFYQFKGKV